MPRPKLNSITRIVLIYMLLSAAWVIFSDRLLDTVVADSAQIQGFQTLKGLIFVSVSSVIVYFLLNNEFEHRQRVEDELRELNSRLEDRINEATAELRTVNARLLTLNEAQRAVIEDVSHALRTPLTTINMRLDLIERADTARIAEYLPGLRNQVDILNNMVTGLLDLSEIEEVPSEAFHPIDLHHLLERVVEAHIGYAGDKGLTLVCTISPNVPLIEGHEPRLNTAFANLTSNAVKYTDHGGVTIDCAYVAARREVVIRVRDTGRGIDPEHIPQLFKRFFRTPSARTSGVPGSGLGLGIVLSIVEQHNGRIDVDSTPGVGSTFSVFLPVTQPTAPGADKAQTA